MDIALGDKDDSPTPINALDINNVDMFFARPVNEVMALQKIIPIPIILVRLNRSPNTPIKTDATE